MKTIIVLLLCSVGAAIAEDDVNLRGLSAEQVSELKIKAEQMRANKDIDAAKRYAEIGTMIGQALASTAKEMNVAVNDFVQTPVGKVAAFLVVWKLFGRELLHYVIGGGFLLFFVPFWLYLYRRMAVIKSVKYTSGSGWWIFRSKTVEHYIPCEVEGTRILMFILLFIIVGVSQAIMWS